MALWTPVLRSAPRDGGRRSLRSGRELEGRHHPPPAETAGRREALLETLALIAYRQPITRGEIEDIRGVSVSTNIVKTLMQREAMHVVGQRDVPGKPSLYGTTREFLDYFGLKSLDDLPSLMELRDIDTINAELELGLPGGRVRGTFRSPGGTA